MNDPCVLILTTIDDRAQAEAMAHALVEERLAACVQIESVDSVYRWEGAVHQAIEFRLQIKTATAQAAAVEARIKELHGYDLPEIVTIPIGGSADYLAWIAGETG